MDPNVAKIMKLSSAFLHGQCIHVAVKLGIFDLFEGEPLDSDVITSKCRLDSKYGFRFLRSLSATGYLKHDGGKIFNITPLGSLLRSDAKIPLSSMVCHFRSDGKLAPFLSETFIKTLKEGTFSGMQHYHGISFWDYMSENPEESRHGNESMKFYSVLEAPILENLIKKIDFENIKTVTDLGGGSGTFLKQILSTEGNEHLLGKVIELPSVVEDTEKLQKHERLSFIAGDLLSEDAEKSKIPKDQDLYLIKAVLHNWTDEMTLKLMKNIYHNAKSGSKLIIVEEIVPEKVDESNGKSVMMDLRMMILLNGKSRTVEEFRELLEQTNWKFEDAIIGSDPSRRGLVISVKE